jgi:serine/threonine-protein kinase HipA
MTELVTMIGDDVIGHLRRDRHGRISFRYADEWRTRPNGYPLSLSMPLTASEHPPSKVGPFLWGLLPDNDRILEGWAKRFQVSAGNPFALLSHVGEDCAGAVRFVTAAQPTEQAGGARNSIQWLRERDVAERLANLRKDASAWRSSGDTGQFSLAGAQPKTALLLDGKRWGVPSGPTPTTHILKPEIAGLDGHAENEHFCLDLASSLGFPVARSRVLTFDNEVAIVVERYDRLRSPSGITRVHQEDLCQAFAIHPARKYENEGGPGAKEVVALLRAHSRDAKQDVETFVEALAFGWLIAGPDAHGKNYSLLISSHGVRLAPLYDVASILPYGNGDLRKVKLAMQIGGKYRVREIGAHEWRKQAATLKLDEDDVLHRVRSIADRIPDHASSALKRARASGLRHDVLPRLADALGRRARACASALGKLTTT